MGEALVAMATSFITQPIEGRLTSRLSYGTLCIVKFKDHFQEGQTHEKSQAKQASKNEKDRRLAATATGTKNKSHRQKRPVLSAARHSGKKVHGARRCVCCQVHRQARHWLHKHGTLGQLSFSLHGPQKTLEGTTLHLAGTAQDSVGGWLAAYSSRIAYSTFCVPPLDVAYTAVRAVDFNTHDSPA